MGDTSDDNSSITSSDSNSTPSLSGYLQASDPKSTRTDYLETEARKLKRDVKSTKSTLEDVDKMLGEYNSVARGQSKAIGKLKETLSSPRHRRPSLSSLRSSDLDSDSRRSRRSSRAHYRTTSPLRDYDEPRRSIHRRPRSAVRFTDDVLVDRDHIHDIHKSLRDLSADHERLESELDREVRSRYKLDREYHTGLSELSSSLRPISRQPSVENIERRLEKKLESIATKLERKQKREANDGITTLSKSLTEALKAPAAPPPLQVQTTPSDFALQQRIGDLESDKRKLQSELDSVKQVKSQDEGAKRALLRQVDELRSQLRDVDDERHRAVRIAEETRDSEKKSRRKQKDMVRSAEDDNHRLQMEVQELRVQLNHSISREDGELLRRELHKHEKQRIQLTEHIETLTKDVAHKEQHTATLLSEVTELTSSKTKLEAELNRTRQELEKAQSSLSETKSQLGHSSREVSGLQDELNAADRRKEEMKSKATEVVKLWKSKCKSVEEELHKHKTIGAAQTDKSEQLYKENDTLRHQLSTVTNQMDRLGKDMSDLMTSNQTLEEKLRAAQSEISHLRKLSTELEHESHSRQIEIEKRERETRKLNDTFINYEAETAQLSDKLVEKRNQLEQIEQEYRQLKAEYSEVHKELGKTLQLLADGKAHIQDLETRLLGSEASEASLRRDVEDLSAKERRLGEKLDSQGQDYSRKLESARKSLAETKSLEAQRSEEYRRRVKQMQTENEAELQAMKIDLEAAQNSIQSVKRQAKSQNDDYVRLEQKYRSLEDEFSQYKIQSKKLKEQLVESQENNDLLSDRAAQGERLQADLENRLSVAESERSSLVQAVSTEFRILVESTQAHTDKEFSNKGDNSLLVDHIPVVGMWVRQVVKEQSECLKKLRDEVRSTVKQDAREKKALISEIKMQQTNMDELSERHRELLDSTAARDAEMSQLEDRVNDLSVHIEEQRALDDAFERQSILDRYERLQSAVSSLKSELRTSRDRSPVSDNMNSSKGHRLKGDPRWTPSKDPNRQVRISDVVTNNDGTQSPLKQRHEEEELPSPISSPTPAITERAQAFSDALGPTSFKHAYVSTAHIDGRYLNDTDSTNLRNESSNKRTSQSRRRKL